MDFFEDFKQNLSTSQIVQLPSMNISSFGSTNYIYYHLSRLEDAKTQVREGQLIIKKPMIIMPNLSTSLVEGFPREVQEFAERIFEKFGNELRLLGYQFKHSPREAWIEKDSIDNVMIELSTHSKDNPMATILVGENQHWEISLLKLYSKIIEKSFHINMAEFEERGLFDPDGIPPQVYKDIEDLFQMVENNPDRIKELGGTLLRYNLFEKYEERFFKLMKRIKH